MRLRLIFSIGICLLIYIRSTAQNSYDSIPYVFGSLNQQKISTGILLDKSYSLLNLPKYNGQFDTIVSYDDFLEIMNDLRNGWLYDSLPRSERQREEQIIHVYSEDKKLKGILFKTTDSSIIIIPETGYLTLQQCNEYKNKINLPPSQIDKIKYFSTKKFMLSAGIGLFTLGIAGSIFGYSQGDDVPPSSKNWTFNFNPLYTAKQKAMFDGIIGGAIGLTAGIIIGVVKITIPIYKSRRQFDVYRDDLREISLVK